MSCPDVRILYAGRTLVGLMLCVLMLCNPATAQRADAVFSDRSLPEPSASSTASAPESGPPPSRVGIGGLAGRTSGLTVRVLLTEESRRSGPFEERSVDVNASFNLNGSLHVTAHVTAERPVENSPLTFYIGPGWLAGADDGEPFFGASGNIGVYFLMGRYQIIMQLMPGLRLTPDVNGETGAAVGLRLQL